jgi:hypothetical protein
MKVPAAAAMLPLLAGAALASEPKPGATATKAGPGAPHSVVLSAPPEKPPTPDEILRHDLYALEIERWQAQLSGDAEALQRLLAEDFAHINHSGRRLTRDDILALYRPGAFTIASAKMDDGSARRYGDVAILTGTLTWSASWRKAPEAEPVDLSGAFDITRVYVMRDGAWRLALSRASKRP